MLLAIGELVDRLVEGAVTTVVVVCKQLDEDMMDTFFR